MVRIKIRSGFRKLVVKDECWQYKVGKAFMVIYSPKNEKTVIPVMVLAPYFERGQWKKTEDGMIRPQQVREYIEKEL